MKFLFAAFFILLTFNVSAQLTTNIMWTEESTLPSNEVIYYSPLRSLEWADFKGPAVTNGMAAAVTVSGFGYKANINTKNGKGTLNISIYCYFNKNKSWVKEGRTIPYILKHEQNHFDISYIASRIFIEKLQKAKFTNANFNVLLPQIYNESCDIMNRMQDDYDGETKNGQVKDIQQKWNVLLDEKISLITK